MKGNTENPNQNTNNTESPRENNGSTTITEIDDTTGNVISAVSNTCEGSFEERIRSLTGVISKVQENCIEIDGDIRRTKKIKGTTLSYLNYLLKLINNPSIDQNQDKLAYFDNLREGFIQSKNKIHSGIFSDSKDRLLLTEEEKTVVNQCYSLDIPLGFIEDEFGKIIKYLKKQNNQEEEK